MNDVILDPRKLIFSGTAQSLGRVISVTPENSGLAHLAYGRIRLDASAASVAFATENRETALLCMKGAARVSVDGTAYELDTYDAIYVPRDSAVQVSTTTEVDLVECSADVEGKYPLQIVRYADVQQNTALKFTAGGAS